MPATNQRPALTPQPVTSDLLAPRLAALENHWCDLVERLWSPASLALLLQRLQDLTTTAAIHEQHAVSRCAVSLAQVAQALLACPAPPLLTQIQVVMVQLRQLRTAIEQALPGSGPAPTLSQLDKGPIAYLHTTPALAPALMTALAPELRTVCCPQLSELLTALAQVQPLVWVVDAPLLPELATMWEQIQRTANQSNPPPLMVLSEQDAIETRLRSLRMGAEAFFVPPLDPLALAAHIRQRTVPVLPEIYRILVVDDDPSQAEFTAAVLRKAEMAVQIVTEPLRVLDALSAFRPDLLLMDLYMPGADGMELTSIIRGQPNFVSTPIIFVSGEQSTDRQLEALSTGGDEFISKPIRPRHLITTIKNRVHRARAVAPVPRPITQAHPALTPLNTLRTHLQQMLMQPASAMGQGGVLCLALDQAAALLAALGIGQRDVLEAEISALLAQHCPLPDRCSRMGERWLLLLRRPEATSLREYGERLLQTVASQAVASSAGLAFSLTISAGLGTVNALAGTAETWLCQAWAACDEAQRQGGNCLVVPATTISPKPPGPENVLAYLREALAQENLPVSFLPLTQLYAETPAQSYELRLDLLPDPDDSIAAAVFLPLARQAGLAPTLNRRLLGRAFEALRNRRRQGEEICLFVPQSGALLAQESYRLWLRAALAANLSGRSRLVLVVNLVDLAADPKTARVLCAELRQLGVAVCLGRFGHNDNSYKLLQYLNAEYICVVDKLLDADFALVNHLIERVHTLGAQVVLPCPNRYQSVGSAWRATADVIPGYTLVAAPLAQ